MPRNTSRTTAPFTPESTLWERIKARRLESNVYALITFIILFVIFTVAFVNADAGTFKDLSNAIATSLLATILISVFDIFTSYKNFENKKFIDNLYRFGIHNLHFDKKDLLSELIQEARNDVWLSGYRLILTRDLSKELYSARERGVNLHFLICPPWEEAYKLVYDDPETTLDNYIHIMKALSQFRDRKAVGEITVHFTHKPLFNDTYLVDEKIVTSPYMHNRDITFGVITAGDFFTYELDKDYRLWQLLKDEYDLLWEESDARLDEDGVDAILRELSEKRFLSYPEKVKVFQNHITETKREFAEVEA